MRITIFLFCPLLCLILPLRSSAGDNAPIIDTRGPVFTTLDVQADAEGVQAPGSSFTKPSPVSSWSAQWIGSSAPSLPDSACTLLRKEFVLEDEPQTVSAWMTAGNYILFINGQQASRGPADFGRDVAGTQTKRWFYDFRNFTGLLHRGKNVLAVEVFSGDFLFQASVLLPQGKAVTLISDPTWKGTSCPFLKNVESPIDDKAKSKKKHYIFAADQEILGWQLAGFDDSAWPACHQGKTPDEPLILSELPPLMEARYPSFNIIDATSGISVPENPFTAGQPVRVNADGDFAVHFSRILAGRCEIKVKGGKGAKLTLFSNETNSVGGRVYEVLLRDGVQYFESPDYYALGTLHVTARGVTSPFEIEEAGAISVSQPVAYAGSFTCNDEKLNVLWKSGRWSTHICMQTLHLDSPQHQEPIGDYGDYLIADLVNYYSMGNNPWLARQDLRKFAWILENARYKTFHTSYILLWLQSLLNYYDYTGDRSILSEVAPQVYAVISQFQSYLGSNGLISEAPNYMFMDWVFINGFSCHHPPAVIGQGYMTAFFYRALADAQRVAELTDDTVHATQFAALRPKIAEAYNRELWNPEQGLYRDGKPFLTSVKPYGWMPEDKAMESFSVQNNSLAVLYDLAPADRQAGIVQKMMQTTPWNVTPYYMHFVLSAIAHAGLFDQFGTERLRTWKIVPETQTVQEMGNHGDYSHGWIATPTYQMSSQILGVIPTSPAFTTFLIHPNLADLEFARGTVPSPRGPIGIDWKRNSDQMELKVIIPAGSVATVDFPVGSASSPKITLAGHAIWVGTQAGDGADGLSKISRVGSVIQFQLAPGTYDLLGSGLVPKA